MYLSLFYLNGGLEAEVDSNVSGEPCLLAEAVSEHLRRASQTMTLVSFGEGRQRVTGEHGGWSHWGHLPPAEKGKFLRACNLQMYGRPIKTIVGSWVWPGSPLDQGSVDKESL